MSGFHLSVLSLAACLGLEVGATEVQIGGMRRAHAVVTQDASGMVCKLSFIPVTCFDAAMNQTVNQQKARSYAILAMARLKGLADSTVLVPNLHPVTAPEVVEGRLTVTYHGDDIKVLDKCTANAGKPSNTKAADGEGRKGPEGSTLVGCVEDTRATLLSVAKAVEEQINQLSAGDKLDDDVVALEVSGQDAFERLTEEVKDQTLLLQVEKNELLTQITQSRDEFLNKLTHAYRTLQQPPKP